MPSLHFEGLLHFSEEEHHLLTDDGQEHDEAGDVVASLAVEDSVAMG